MRQGREHAGAITRIFVGTPGAAMIHATGEMISIFNDLMAAFAFYMRNKSNTAGIMLICRIIKSSRSRSFCRNAL
jgi:hypothetical protein